MSFSQILVRFTFILMTCFTCLPPGLAQQSGSVSTVGGQIVLSATGGLRKPVPVLLDHFGAQNHQWTQTDLRGHFEFHNIPPGSYYIRVEFEGFQNVKYRVDVPGTPYVSIFLNRRAVLVHRADTSNALSGSQVVDIRQLSANIPKQAI